jgi:F0F1-type ATP synthase delta subunit
MELDLSPFFKTKAQAMDFNQRLSGISAKVYETNFNLESSLLDEFGIQKKDKFMTLLRDNKINPESPADLKKFFGKIQTTINTIPVLSMTIAFEPKEKTLQALSEWFLMNIKKQMLLEVTVDTNLIAGAKLQYKGKFVDGSIKPLFDNIVQQMMTNSADKQPEKEAPKEQQQPAHN